MGELLMTPADDAAEKAVLGSMLVAPEFLHHAIEVIGDRPVFYWTQHRELYERIRWLRSQDRRRAVDAMVVLDSIDDDCDPKPVHDLVIEVCACYTTDLVSLETVMRLWLARSGRLILMDAFDGLHGSGSSAYDALRACRNSLDELLTGSAHTARQS